MRSFVSKYLDKLNLEELNDLIEFLDNNDEDIYKFKQGIKIMKNIKNNNITNLFRNFEI